MTDDLKEEDLDEDLLDPPSEGDNDQWNYTQSSSIQKMTDGAVALLTQICKRGEDYRSYHLIDTSKVEIGKIYRFKQLCNAVGEPLNSKGAMVTQAKLRLFKCFMDIEEVTVRAETRYKVVEIYDHPMPSLYLREPKSNCGKFLGEVVYTFLRAQCELYRRKHQHCDKYYTFSGTDSALLRDLGFQTWDFQSYMWKPLPKYIQNPKYKEGENEPQYLEVDFSKNPEFSPTRKRIMSVVRHETYRLYDSGLRSLSAMHQCDGSQVVLEIKETEDGDFKQVNNDNAKLYTESYKNAYDFTLLEKGCKNKFDPTADDHRQEIYDVFKEKFLSFTHAVDFRRVRRIVCKCDSLFLDDFIEYSYDQLENILSYCRRLITHFAYNDMRSKLSSTKNVFLCQLMLKHLREMSLDPVDEDSFDSLAKTQLAIEMLNTTFGVDQFIQRQGVFFDYLNLLYDKAINERVDKNLEGFDFSQNYTLE